MLRVNDVTFGVQQDNLDQELKSATVTQDVEVRNGILRLRAVDPDPSARNVPLTHLEFRRR